MGEEDVPSHGSGLVRACRSSMENLTSTPFSMRESGSAFKSQYEQLGSSALASTDSDLDWRVTSAPFWTLFLGRPTGRFPSRGVLGLEGVSIRISMDAHNRDPWIFTDPGGNERDRTHQEH